MKLIHVPRLFLSLVFAFHICLNAAEHSMAPLLQPFVERHQLAGAVLCVASKDKILDVETVGFADVEAGKPMASNAVFWIASQTKAITAAAVMMLVDEGKLTLDDPVEKYLPEFKGQMVVAEKDENHVLLRKPSHPITLREVLSHTSGLPFSSPMEQPTLDLLPLRDAVRSYAMGPLQFEPGTKFQYSNAGINTAARVLEVITGMDYEEFLQQRLLGPLGMKDTTFRPNKEQISRLAKSYKPNASKDGLEATIVTQLFYPLDDPRRQPMPAGGLFSTISDVARFCQMLANNGLYEGKRYLSESSVKLMTTKQTGPNVQDRYGLGLFVGDTWFEHGGAYSTNMHIERQSGIIVLWMVQHAGFPGDGDKARDVFKNAALERFGKH